ncbi:hypothetical protein BO71DRAFT_436346 [Aspergillus ellipticus CBS 707.79]|uniref:Transcription factor domain-containing protein n=1 Tax=Aspergillus ellipticus CBS 707.79 TaxID=1448320 RepID=A0A319CSZ1_9EURO|nr:hypothetical protein BO71DRAFT_436346 [Aspergillus ellipticus CBS 707.79]
MLDSLVRVSRRVVCDHYASVRAEAHRFTIIPAPIVLDSLSRAREYIDSNSWDVARNWKSLHQDVTAATTLSLKLSAALSARNFYTLSIGTNLRREFMGFIFALAGIKTFTKEMILASNACIEICKQCGQANDLMTWMRYFHVGLGTEVLGETSERVVSHFGDLVSDIYAMGLHHRPLEDVPLFVTETRKRMLSVSHRTDKNLATLLGRPPRLPHYYFNSTVPLDIADDELFLDAPSLDAVLQGLDDDGWNRDGKLYPSTVIWMRHFLSILREQVLEISLGNRTARDHGDRLLRTYSLCEEITVQIPTRFRYSPACWQTLDAIECLARSIIHFEHVLIYGIPAAGVLATELHSHTLANKPLLSAAPRSEIIRTLSILTSWLQNSEMPPSSTGAACIELTNVISRLLDDTLNHQPDPSTQEPDQDITRPGVQDVLDSAPSGSGISAPSEAFGIGLCGEEFLSWLDDLELDLVSLERFI